MRPLGEQAMPDDRRTDDRTGARSRETMVSLNDLSFAVKELTTNNLRLLLQTSTPEELQKLADCACQGRDCGCDGTYCQCDEVTGASFGSEVINPSDFKTLRDATVKELIQQLQAIERNG